MPQENDSYIKSSSLRRRMLLGLYLIPTPAGMVIQNIDPAAPVAKTGLQPGDRLETANGNRIVDPISMLDWQRSLQEGQQVCLQANRQGQKVRVSFYPAPVALEEPAEGNVNEYGDFSADGERLRSIFSYAFNASHGEGESDESLPGVLLLPGLGGMPCDQPGPGNLARDIAQNLAGHGALVMRYDQRGVGDSEGCVYADIDFLTEVADAKMALETLAGHHRCNPRDLRLVGLSLGGVMAFLIAGGSPRVKRVCLWGSSARPWVNYALENSLIQAGMRKVPEEQIMNVQNLCCLLWGLVAATDMSAEALLQSFPALKEFGLTEKYLNAKVLSFWRQLARTNTAAAYGQCAFRLLVLRGEYDALSHLQDLQSILKAAKEAGLKATGGTILGVDHFCNAGNSMLDCYTRLWQGKVSYQPEKLLKPLTEWLLEGKVGAN